MEPSANNITPKPAPAPAPGGGANNITSKPTTAGGANNITPKPTTTTPGGGANNITPKPTTTTPGGGANNITPKPTTTTPPPPPAGGGTSASARRRRKGGAAAGIEIVDLHDSKYAQIRTLLRDLRPAFIEILKTSDYRNGKSAFEIRRGMKNMMELCKQLRTETVNLGKNKRSIDGLPAAGENMDDHNNKRQKDDTSHETYIVGGSPVGWNFVMFLKTENKSTVGA